MEIALSITHIFSHFKQFQPLSTQSIDKSSTDHRLGTDQTYKDTKGNDVRGPTKNVLPSNCNAYNDDATMRALRQTFVLTAAVVVTVDQSVKQATTNLTYVIKSTNTHVQNMFHRTLLITNVSIFCGHPRGSFTRVQGIQQSAIQNIWNHSML
jgi:hypothetical protein